MAGPKTIDPKQLELMREIASRGGPPVEKLIADQRAPRRQQDGTWDQKPEERLAPSDERRKGVLSKNFDGNATGTNITGGPQTTMGMLGELGKALENSGTAQSHGTKLIERRMDAAGLNSP